jgi:hypothetical protein
VTDSSLYCHARLGEGKRNFQFHLPSWRKKFLVKTKRFAAYASLKNKKSIRESMTRQRQKQKTKTKKKTQQQRLTTFRKLY